MESVFSPLSFSSLFIIETLFFHLKWDFAVGAAAASGEGNRWGPFGGVGSGPMVEKMLEAMDSWSGLCLHYRCPSDSMRRFFVCF